jgi:hypothetical protein
MLDRRDRAYLRIIVDVPRPGGHTRSSYRGEDNDGWLSRLCFRNSGLKESTDACVRKLLSSWVRSW